MNAGGPAIQQVTSHAQTHQLQNDAIRTHAKQLRRSLSILEAGCGQRWPLDLAGVDFTLTGVDLDAVALEMRKTQARDLDVAICGDLCTVELPEASFDVVFSAFVLEHVPRADRALANLVKWLRPGGLLILRLPERQTVHGFYTRVLPHWAHVAYYRYIHHSQFAGQPGYAPYPTYYHPVISRERLIPFLAENGVSTLNCYGDGFKRPNPSLARRMVKGIEKLTSMLSFGSLAGDYKDLLYIAVKKDPMSAQK
ncbi:MAG: class I SAM-dependent methyltransferase [Terracidiphilus sp.]